MTQLEIELDLCKSDFRFFLGYCFYHTFGKKFMFYKFHDDIINILLNMDEDNNRIIINAPPRIGKTEIVKHYIAWRFLQDPSSSVIYISYEERLVARKNREIRDLLKWLAKHFKIKGLEMLPNTDSKVEWVNHANGTILARGSMNGITGSGCSTVMVIDDPNKPTDRNSPAILESRNAVFTNTIRNRINHTSVPIIVIQQRVAAMDLTGYLLSGGVEEKWVQHKFPAIGEDGESICPERLPLVEINTYKSDPFTYNAQYLQVPLDDIGKLFDKNKIIPTTHRPPTNQMRLVISVDASSKAETGSDFNAISVIGYASPNYYILDVHNFKADITNLIAKVKEVRKKWGASTPVLFESKANGTAAIQILRRETSGILEVNPTKNKVERAIMVKYLFDSLNVHFAIRGLVWGEILSQFTMFPHAKHDDIVDSIVQGITWLQALPDALRSKQPVKNKTQQVELRRPVYGGSRASNGYSASFRS